MFCSEFTFLVEIEEKSQVVAVLLAKNHCVRINEEIRAAISRVLYTVECFYILLMSHCVFVFQCYRRVTDEINLEGICSMFESGETDTWPPLPCFCNFVWFVRVAETEAFCVIRG